MWNFNNNLLEKVTSGAALATVSYSFGNDRTGTANDAILFSTGYVQVPNGIWFSGPLTITVWALMTQVVSYGRIIDFATSTNTADNIVFSMFLGTALTPYLYICNNGVYAFIQTPANAFSLNTWVHLAGMVSGTSGSIYINGVVSVTGALIEPRSISRTQNFIGKQLWDGSPDISGYYDDLMIFNTALTATQVNNVKNTLIH